MLLTRSTPEQRRPLYEDVEALITPGFLSHSVTIRGVHLCMRSLSPGDVYLLNARTQAPMSDWRAWAVASSVWMVNGYCILGEHTLTPRLYRFVRALPKQSREVLVSILTGLLQRQNRAVDSTEAYCFEHYSRYRWKTFGSMSPGLASGLPGIESVGTNHVQRMWVAFNQVEDQRLAEMVEWEGVKLVAAAWNPKGVKQLDQKDSQNRDEERERRQRVCDSFYYRALGIDVPDSVFRQNQQGDYVRQARTADELAEEMRRWVAGEMDEHDKIVADYKTRLMARREAEKQARQQRLEAVRRAQEDEGFMDQPVPLVGLTAEEVAKALQAQGGYTPGVRQLAGDDHAERLYNKFVNADLSPGHISIEGGRLNAPQVEIDKNQHIVRLQEEIAQRSVLYRPDPDEDRR